MTMTMESNETKNNHFIYLLNIPIVRQQILQYLPIKCLIRLRGVSRTIKLLIDEIYLPFELTMISESMLPNDIHKASDILQDGFQTLLTQTHSLRYLNLDFSKRLTDNQLIDILKSNTNLKYLYLDSDKCSQTVLHSIIVHGRNVKVLHLRYYEVNSDSFEGIETEEIRWEELGLYMLDFTSYYIGRLLKKCEYLRTLTLKLDMNTYIEDFRDIGKALENCKNLKMVHIYYEKLNQKIENLSYLANCKNIESLWLNLSWCSITKENLKELSKVTSLKQLVFDDCNLIETGLDDLAACENLQTLSLNENKWVTDDALKTITHFRNLRKLDLVDCHEVTPTGISNLAKGCPSLEAVIVRSGEDHGRECFRIFNVVVHVLDAARHSCITHGENFRIDD